MRVNITFSGFRVTVAGGEVPAPPPPLKVVREKLAFTIRFRFKYQLRPTDHADAELAEMEGSAKSGNASESMFNCAYRPTNCKAPHSP